MMRRFTLFLCLLIWLLFPVDGVRAKTRTRPAVRFEAMDVYVDSGKHKLVAYQVEMRFDKNRVEIVGVEGGEVGAFREAPHYDARGLAGGKIILAAFTTDHKNAPMGRTRVARSHLRIEGGEKPEVEIRLMTAAEPGGRRIAAKAELLPSASGGMVDEEEGGK